MTLVDTFAADGLPPREEWPDLLIEPLGYPAQLNCAVALLDETVAAGQRRRAPRSSRESETLSYARAAGDRRPHRHVLVDDLGLVSGNRVLLRAPNTPMLVACWFAVAKAGGIVVATMPLLRRKELAGDRRARRDRRSRSATTGCSTSSMASASGSSPFGELSERLAAKPAASRPTTPPPTTSS